MKLSMEHAIVLSARCQLDLNDVALKKRMVAIVSLSFVIVGPKRVLPDDFF